MTKKRNGFLRFCCSLLPGAGEMYMGFMKMGLSLMSMFFGIIVAASIFPMPPLFLLPQGIFSYHEPDKFLLL